MRIIVSRYPKQGGQWVGGTVNHCVVVGDLRDFKLVWFLALASKEIRQLPKASLALPCGLQVLVAEP